MNDSDYNCLTGRKERSVQLASEFYQTFRMSLRQYFSLLEGFNVIKFDETFLKTQDGESCKQCVQRRFGTKAVRLITQLIGN